MTLIKSRNTKRIFFWALGFVVLLLIDVLVEAVLLPHWGLDKTEKNDIYFKVWWVVVGLWFIFGLFIINYFDKRSKKKL